MEWEEQIEEELCKNLSNFLYNELSEIDCNEIMIYKSDKYMDMVDKLNSQICGEIAEFIKLRTASIIDEKANDLKSETEVLIKK